MRKTSFFFTIIFLIVMVTLQSCNTQVADNVEPAKIENTLKSVSFWSDSLNIDPTLLQASIDRLNEAIDSIGYPDAGYQLWIVQSDTIGDYRVLLNGNWPNQELYNEIHNHELYKNALPFLEESFKDLNMISYDRFILVK